MKHDNSDCCGYIIIAIVVLIMIVMIILYFINKNDDKTIGGDYQIFTFNTGKLKYNEILDSVIFIEQNHDNEFNFVNGVIDYSKCCKLFYDETNNIKYLFIPLCKRHLYNIKTGKEYYHTYGFTLVLEINKENKIFNAFVLGDIYEEYKTIFNSNMDIELQSFIQDNKYGIDIIFGYNLDNDYKNNIEYLIFAKNGSFVFKCINDDGFYYKTEEKDNYLIRKVLNKNIEYD